MNKETHVLILAAGRGTRMKSSIPKVMHNVNGKPILSYIIDAGVSLHPVSLSVVIGHGSDMVEEYFKNKEINRSGKKISFIEQKEQKGTGHAVAVAEKNYEGSNGVLLILCGDTPLISSDLLTEFADYYHRSSSDLAVLTLSLDDPTGYGRVVTDSSGNVAEIVEHKDASAEQRKIKEVNSGIYIIRIDKCFQYLKKLDSDNIQGEYYLPDLIKIFNTEGLKVGKFQWNNPTDLLGINNRKELANTDKILRMRKMDKLMTNGVTIYDPDNTYIEEDVKIERDAIIYPGVVITGRSKISEGCEIHHHSRLDNVIVGSGTVVHTLTSIVDSEIGENCSIGPYARLRPGNKIADKVKIGNFVEVKKAVIGMGSKASHLSYLGDAEIGENVNIGAGTITCNYDGWQKYRTVIKDGAFIGSNTEIVAPVVIGRGAVVGAGTTVTDDVPDDALAVSRTDQKNIEGWASKKRAKMKSKNKKK